MLKYMIMLCAAVLIIGCGASQKEEEKVPAKPTIDGEKLFKTNCVLCHGEDGKLGLNNSKDLSVSLLTLEERIEMVTNGKNLMVGFAALLSEEEIKAVAEYTFSLKEE